MIDNNFPIYLITFILTFIITVSVSRIIIPILKKKAEQPIYTDGPKWHISKSGTPTMGGLAFLISVSIILSLAILFLFLSKNEYQAISLSLCLSYAVLNSAIGIIDDKVKLKRKENAGLTPSEKLILQFLAACLFLVLRYILLDSGTAISFSFGNIDLKYFYYPISVIILLGITNCANLTDGIDGLASGVAFATGLSLFYISCSLFSDVCFISAAVIGAVSGFLIFNIHPAKVFMGDTGSLFLGSLLAASSFALENPFVIVCAGAVYVLEGISVIIQVIVFKLTGRRVFKMAPLHHHLERCGWSENRICICAILFTLLASIPAYIFYLP